jgi:hypothetical protein
MGMGIKVRLFFEFEIKIKYKKQPLKNRLKQLEKIKNEESYMSMSNSAFIIGFFISVKS